MPPTTRAPRRLLAVALSGLLLVGACSSDDDGDDAGTTTTSRGGTPTTTTAPADGTTAPDGGGDEPGGPADPAADAALARAEAANLTVEDFPSGWQNLPPSEAEVGVIDICATVDLEAHRLAQARSDGFSYTIEPGTLAASTAVSVFDGEEVAAALLAEFRGDPLVRCATDQLTQGTDTYTITGELTRNDTEPGLGDEAVALSGDFVVSPSDGSPDHTVSSVVVAIRRGDTVATFNSTATDRALDEQVLRDLLTALDRRLAG